MRSICCGVVIIAALVVGDRALAAIACSFSTVSGVVFGNYSPFSTTPLDSIGTITFSCTGAGGQDTVYIDLGDGNAPNYWPRYMLNASSVHLNYNLYLAGDHAQVWGDGTGGTYRKGPLDPDNQPVTVQVFGRIPINQNVSAGSYSDTIVVTITF